MNHKNDDSGIGDDSIKDGNALSLRLVLLSQGSHREDANQATAAYWRSPRSATATRARRQHLGESCQWRMDDGGSQAERRRHFAGGGMLNTKTALLGALLCAW